MTKRLTQHQRQERRGGKVPQVKPRGRNLLDVNHWGLSERDPIICGLRGDETPLLVEATGMVFGIRKGLQRWVVGADVATAIAGGLLIRLGEPEPPPPARPTRLADGTPGSAPELPGRVDQWHYAFTPCVHCGERPASPGEEWCEHCLAEAAGETPLERALRQARS